MANFHSFLWLNCIPLCVCVYTYTHRLHLIYPFICWWTLRLLLYLSKCTWGHHEHWDTCVFLISVLGFFKYIPRSRTAGSSVQFNSAAQSCPTLCDPMNRSMSGLPVHHQLPEFTETHVHRVGDAIQPSNPLSFPSLLAPNPSQHQGLFQWVNSSHEVAKVLEFQL